MNGILSRLAPKRLEGVFTATSLCQTTVNRKTRQIPLVSFEYINKRIHASSPFDIDRDWHSQRLDSTVGVSSSGGGGYHADSCHDGLPHFFTGTVKVRQPNRVSGDCDNRF